MQRVKRCLRLSKFTAVFARKAKTKASTAKAIQGLRYVLRATRYALRRDGEYLYFFLFIILNFKQLFLNSNIQNLITNLTFLYY